MSAMHRCAPLALVLAACLAAGCASRATPKPFPGATAPAPSAPAEAPATAPAPVATAAVPSIVVTALALRGAPYRNGGSDPSGFDCSGFVKYVFAQHGRVLPRETKDQFQLGEKIDRDDVKPGDLIFFQTVSKGASHVGIALGGNEFVHAPSSRGVVRVEKYTGGYWAARWVGARRIRAS